MSFLKRFILLILALLIGTIIWLPLVSFLFKENTPQYFSNNSSAIAPKARLLAARHLQLWTDADFKAEEINKMRESNAEWDFMGRSFLVWALANMALREPSSKENLLEIIDRIIDETIRLEKEKGHFFFLMAYANYGKLERSQFIDSEIALMLALRRLVEEKPEYKPLLSERVNIMVERMKKSPVLSSESYPNECWTFDNSVALAAMKISDFLDGSGHSDFITAWLNTAKERLVDPETGLLVSSYTLQGVHLDGPEGSTIWLVAHCLQLVDEDFALDQYTRAKKELARNILGFGYAVEWPVSWQSPADIDSGPIIPVLGVSAGASGLAFVGAASFNDRKFLSGLLTTLNFAAFPIQKKGMLKYAASNQVGDAVLLYSMALGPAWQRVKKGVK